MNNKSRITFFRRYQGFALTKKHSADKSKERCSKTVIVYSKVKSSSKIKIKKLKDKKSKKRNIRKSLFKKFHNKRINKRILRLEA